MSLAGCWAATAWTSSSLASDGGEQRSLVAVEVDGRELAEAALLLESVDHGTLLRLDDLSGALPPGLVLAPVKLHGELFLPLDPIAEHVRLEGHVLRLVGIPYPDPLRDMGRLAASSTSPTASMLRSPYATPNPARARSRPAVVEAPPSLPAGAAGPPPAVGNPPTSAPELFAGPLDQISPAAGPSTGGGPAGLPVPAAGTPITPSPAPP
ncbi:MAG: hypothetical protein AAF637_06845, partial [Pseudomonadota bacterium]